MKTILLTFTLSLIAVGGAIAAATVVLDVEKENGELKVLHDRTQAGFIERGVKNYGRVRYTAEPGTYTVTGTNPGCPVVVQSAAFEEGKSYNLVLTKDCKIKKVAF